MRQLIRFLILITIALSALLVAPQAVFALSGGCTDLNDPFLDRNYGQTFQASRAYQAGDVITISVTSVVPAGATLTLQVPDGTTVASTSAPGTVIYRFPADFTGDISWNIGASNGNFTVSCGREGEGSALALPPDDRLNWQHGDLTAVLYLRADDSGEAAIEVFQVGADSSGNFLCRLTRDDMTDFEENRPTVNTLILECSPTVRWYMLTSGEVQVNIGPDGGGNEYVMVFDSDTLQPVGRYKFGV
jgi:hypothetical protein